VDQKHLPASGYVPTRALCVEFLFHTHTGTVPCEHVAGPVEAVWTCRAASNKTVWNKECDRVGAWETWVGCCRASHHCPSNHKKRPTYTPASSLGPEPVHVRGAEHCSRQASQCLELVRGMHMISPCKGTHT
jgi:hypothetical protein